MWFGELLDGALLLGGADVAEADEVEVVAVVVADHRLAAFVAGADDRGLDGGLVAHAPCSRSRSAARAGAAAARLEQVARGSCRGPGWRSRGPGSAARGSGWSFRRSLDGQDARDRVATWTVSGGTESSDFAIGREPYRRRELPLVAVPAGGGGARRRRGRRGRTSGRWPWWRSAGRRSARSGSCSRSSNAPRPWDWAGRPGQGGMRQVDHRQEGRGRRRPRTGSGSPGSGRRPSRTGRTSSRKLAMSRNDPRRANTVPSRGLLLGRRQGGHRVAPALGPGRRAGRSASLRVAVERPPRLPRHARSRTTWRPGSRSTAWTLARSLIVLPPRLVVLDVAEPVVGPGVALLEQRLGLAPSARR